MCSALWVCQAAAAPARGSMFVRAKSASPPPARGSQKSASASPQGRGSMFGRAPARGSQSASPVRGSQKAPAPKRGSMFSFGGQPDLSDARAKQAVRLHTRLSPSFPPSLERVKAFGVKIHAFSRRVSVCASPPSYDHTASRGWYIRE